MRLKSLQWLEEADGVLHLAIICFLENVDEKQDGHAYHYPGYIPVANASRRILNFTCFCATDVHLRTGQRGYHHRLVWNHHSIICGCYLRLSSLREYIAGQVPMKRGLKCSGCRSIKFNFFPHGGWQAGSSQSSGYQELCRILFLVELCRRLDIESFQQSTC
ncbi:hypothetical protein ASPBRDRAFT_36839 [Aspergillus brasiliensis CBS 101740]|uniref:Uncharacterized protein n=1 Tax=Aspergillus brasiliensis (strain CBS 101740 / IMI 381727 / IBT 21946) TaxID=767769 RepID=A0A1L9V0Z1_ASPBC|nr:hypothetical protein ASPBRDRAFT_36839 [Aspergillus brasiliensis CBS 101740]